MKLLVDVITKQWIEKNSHTKEAVWLNTCWEMYKKVPDEPSRIMVQGAIDEVMKLSDGIIMIKHETEGERKYLQGEYGV